ncbi:MAG: hypothetical protein ACM3S1_04905 [Hyphomicrobiales bacterium]
MAWFKRLFRREASSHEAWLAAHPDKAAMPKAPATANDEEEARIRARMEHELEEARAQRGE